LNAKTPGPTCRGRARGLELGLESFRGVPVMSTLPQTSSAALRELLREEEAR